MTTKLDVVLNRIIKFQVIFILFAFIFSAIISLYVGYSSLHLLSNFANSKENVTIPPPVFQRPYVPNYKVKSKTKPRTKSKSKTLTKVKKINHNFTFNLINGSEIKAQNYKKDNDFYKITDLRGMVITIKRSKVSIINKFTR